MPSSLPTLDAAEAWLKRQGEIRYVGGDGAGLTYRVNGKSVIVRRCDDKQGWEIVDANAQ